MARSRRHERAGGCNRKRCQDDRQEDRPEEGD